MNERQTTLLVAGTVLAAVGVVTAIRSAVVGSIGAVATPTEGSAIVFDDDPQLVPTASSQHVDPPIADVAPTPAELSPWDGHLSSGTAAKPGSPAPGVWMFRKDGGRCFFEQASLPPSAEHGVRIELAVAGFDCDVESLVVSADGRRGFFVAGGVIVVADLERGTLSRAPDAPQGRAQGLAMRDGSLWLVSRQDFECGDDGKPSSIDDPEAAPPPTCPPQTHVWLAWSWRWSGTEWVGQAHGFFQDPDEGESDAADRKQNALLGFQAASSHDDLDDRYDLEGHVATAEGCDARRVVGLPVFACGHESGESGWIWTGTPSFEVGTALAPVEGFQILQFELRHRDRFLLVNGFATGPQERAQVYDLTTRRLVLDSANVVATDFWRP